MPRSIRSQFARFSAAYVAAAAATVIVRLRRHVHVDPNHLGTLVNVFHHKCGVLMVLSITWFWYEAIRLFLLTARRHRILSW